MYRTIILVLSLGLVLGCAVPNMYKTKVYEKNGAIFTEQQGKGTVEAEKTADGWKIKTDYKSVPLLMDVTKLVAVKEINGE